VEQLRATDRTDVRGFRLLVRLGKGGHRAAVAIAVTVALTATGWFTPRTPAGATPVATAQTSSVAVAAGEARSAAAGAAESIIDSSTPVTGGRLNMLGTGDVDYMDPNIMYYSTSYLVARLFSRQLVTFPAVPGKVTTDVADLATRIPTKSNGGISADGLTYAFHIKKGANWDTVPARQITGNDFIRGLKRTCNPAQPFGGLPNFLPLISGLKAFCDGYAKVDGTSASAMAAYQNGHGISGVKADASDPTKLTIKLTHPATYFLSILSMTAFSPAPKEYDAYIPGGARISQHIISDGPYKITKYLPSRSISLVRNSNWDPATDTVRKAYVDAVEINETGDSAVIQQQLEADTPDADMESDTFPPATVVPQLIQSHDPNFSLGQTFASNPYIVFNTVSPNNHSALQNVKVRQALSEAISRANIIQADNGPLVSPPLTHVLPAGISGTQSNTSIDLYPYDVNKATADLQAAGASHLTLKFLYRPASSLSSKLLTLLRQDLGKAGIKVVGVAVSNWDFYTKYLQVPSQAQRGVWDITIAGWGPDWYGDAALSFFAPLFQGKTAFPPQGSNFGLYNNAAVNSAIDAAAREVDPVKARQLWAALDRRVMRDAPFYPITVSNQPTYHAPHVHNTVFIPTLQQLDPANVWLSK
jgi:peptide/nickel transport system substrate-binding protein